MAPQAAEATDTNEIGAQVRRLFDFSRRVLGYWWVVAASLVVGAVACAVFFVVRTPHYRSETVILYSEGLRTDRVLDPGPTPQNTAMRLEEMLKSRPRLQGIIKTFGLYPDIVERYGYVDAVDEFREHISFRAPGSDTYTIGFEGTSPEQAQTVTSAITESLIKEDQFMRRKKAQVARDFLAEERNRINEELKNVELELAEFLAEHPGFALDAMIMMPGGVSTGAAVRAAEAGADAKTRTVSSPGNERRVWRAVRVPASGGGSAAHVPAELQTALARAQADFAAAQTALSGKLALFTEAHPDVQAASASVARAQRRLQAAEAAIAAAQARAARTAQTKTKIVYKPQVVSSSKKKDKDEKKSAEKPLDLVALETAWAKLTRNVSEARARYDQIDTSYFKASLAASSESEGHAVQITVLDPAFLPVKTTPPGPLTLTAIFVVLSLLVGTLLAIALAALDDRVLSARDLAPLGPRVIEIPTAKLARRAHA